MTPSDTAKNAPHKPYALPTNDKLPLKNTTIEGRVENGELKGLVVTPASRRADLLVTEPPAKVRE